MTHDQAILQMNNEALQRIRPATQRYRDIIRQQLLAYWMLTALAIIAGFGEAASLHAPPTVATALYAVGVIVIAGLQHLATWRWENIYYAALR